jgi:hypothetical protein
MFHEESVVKLEKKQLRAFTIREITGFGEKIKVENKR